MNKKELRELCEKATSGPWEAENEVDGNGFKLPHLYAIEDREECEEAFQQYGWNHFGKKMSEQ